MMEYYSVTKENELLIQTTVEMNLKNCAKQNMPDVKVHSI